MIHDIGDSMSIQWYVLRSKPRKETSLYQYAVTCGHDVYCPEIPAHPVNPRAAKVKPYFPGYMFVRTCLSLVGESTFRWMPFSQGLVHIGGEPTPVPDFVVTAIRQRIDQIWTSGPESAERFRRGDRVLISEGAFAGYEGIFDGRLSGHDRVRILLRLLNDRFVGLEVSERNLELFQGTGIEAPHG